MKNIPTNPFLITGYQGPDYFCDRKKFSLLKFKNRKKNYIFIPPPRGRKLKKIV